MSIRKPRTTAGDLRLASMLLDVIKPTVGEYAAFIASVRAVERDAVTRRAAKARRRGR